VFQRRVDCCCSSCCDDVVIVITVWRALFKTIFGWTLCLNFLLSSSDSEPVVCDIDWYVLIAAGNSQILVNFITMEKQRNEQAAGEVHSWMDQFHEKFLTPQLEIVSTDPGKFLAWLVLLSSLLTFILGHVVYLAMFLLIYITWTYSEHIQENDASDKEADENEWLLDKFFCFLQQLDNESFDLDLTAIPSSDDVDSKIAEKAEFETDDVKTTCSVAFTESDSLAENDEESTDSDNDEDEDDEFTDSEFEEEFEFISQDDL